MTLTLMKSTLFALALGLSATSAQAEWRPDPNQHEFHPTRHFGQLINERQARQRERIEAGRQTGELTRREFRKLMREQDEIAQMERHFREDGIDRREFRQLQLALDIASENIKAEKHDRQAHANRWDTYSYN